MSASLRSWMEEPFTLALSSGFFGFYAHCGVMAALYENGVRPSRITGSSAGALVAGAMASGLSPAEMREILFSMDRKDFWDPFPGPGLLRGRLFQRLLEKFFAPTFAEAKIPVEICVFDLVSWKTKFLKEGSLCKAVAASCAVPFMFHPVRIGKRFFVDGGTFLKSGLNPEHVNERVLCVYLQSKGITSAYEWNSSLKKLGPWQRVLSLADLPAVGPNAMANGRAAYEEAYRRTHEALARAFHEKRVEA